MDGCVKAGYDKADDRPRRGTLGDVSTLLPLLPRCARGAGLPEKSQVRRRGVLPGRRLTQRLRQCHPLGQPSSAAEEKVEKSELGSLFLPSPLFSLFLRLGPVASLVTGLMQVESHAIPTLSGCGRLLWGSRRPRAGRGASLRRGLLIIVVAVSKRASLRTSGDKRIFIRRLASWTPASSHHTLRGRRGCDAWMRVSVASNKLHTRWELRGGGNSSSWLMIKSWASSSAAAGL